MRLLSILVALAITSVSQWSSAFAQPPKVYSVPVTGTIELGVAPFIKRSIREAEAAGAQAIILRINTLGGRVDAALEIVDAIGESTVPIYALVAPRAISAGALIAISTDSVFMVPDAHLGASTVVGGTGEKVSEKAQSVMRAQFRALAERRGLDPRIGEAMVDEDIVIPGVIEEGKLLTLTTGEAQKVGYAVEADNFEDVLAKLNLQGAEVVLADINWAEKLVRFLTHPVVAAILLPLGMLALFTELKAPGFGIAGGIGVVALALFFGSHMLVGLAGWEEVILLVAGFILLIVEIFILPGFGIAGILGILGIGAAIFLALLGDYHTTDDLWRATMIIGVTLVVMIIVPFLLARYLPKRKNSFGVRLDAATTREEGYVSGVPRSDLIGKQGTAYTDLRPTGTALIGDERIDVVCETGFMLRGSPLQVVGAEPYRTIVAPIA